MAKVVLNIKIDVRLKEAAARMAAREFSTLTNIVSRALLAYCEDELDGAPPRKTKG